MAITAAQKKGLNNMNRYAQDAQLGTIIETLQTADATTSIVHFTVAAASATAASNVSVHAAVTLGAAVQNVTATTQPTVARNVIVKGNAAGIAGDVVITGTNYLNEVITETIALNAATAVAGTKAFKTITNINLPAKTNGSGDTVSIGTGEVLGLWNKLSLNTVSMAFADGTKEATAPTVTVSATAIESNTIDLATALNSKQVDAYYTIG